jgi:hypothetical protein
MPAIGTRSGSTFEHPSVAGQAASPSRGTLNYKGVFFKRMGTEASSGGRPPPQAPRPAGTGMADRPLGKEKRKPESDQRDPRGERRSDVLAGAGEAVVGGDGIPRRVHALDGARATAAGQLRPRCSRRAEGVLGLGRGRVPVDRSHENHEDQQHAPSHTPTVRRGLRGSQRAHRTRSYLTNPLPKMVLHFERRATFEKAALPRFDRPVGAIRRAAPKNEKRPRRWPLPDLRARPKTAAIPKVVLRGSFRVAPTDFRGVPDYSTTAIRGVQGERSDLTPTDRPIVAADRGSPHG